MPAYQNYRNCARPLIPVFAWICAALSLRYSYYGDRTLQLGANSSRMMKMSSLFVEEVHVKANAEQGVLVYGFNAKPELSETHNWTMSTYLNVNNTCNRQGYTLWLNKGSQVSMEWRVVGGGRNYKDMLVVLIRGAKNLEVLRQYFTRHPRKGNSAEYIIPDDDAYFVGVVNLTPRSTKILLKVNVSSKVYDTRRATSVCSAVYGVCNIEVFFPGTQYYVIETTSENSTNLLNNPLSVEFSFVARVVAYFLITVFIVVAVSMILKCIGGCDCEQTREEDDTEATETDPILSSKEMPYSYGTNEEEPQSSLCCPSDDLYDGKICIICYDERRSSFFIPCGHSATCYSCAKRIMEDENKNCPICRRLIHKTKRLPIPKEIP